MVRAYFPQRYGGSLVTNTNNPPQGTLLGDVVPPIVVEEPLLAIYPPLGDLDYSNYKFYQVNKGQFVTPGTNFIWEITDSVGPGVFQEASGFDIRPFFNNERDLDLAFPTGNSFDPELNNIVASQLSDDRLHLFIWITTGVIHEWILSAPGVFPADGTPSDFQFTPAEITGRDIKFLDNGNEMALVGIEDDVIRIYSLPTRNSLSTTPVLLQSFDATIATTTPASCDFSDDEMKLYVLSQFGDEVNQWNLKAPRVLPEPGTLPDRVFPYNPTVAVSSGNVRMFPDGSAFYIVSSPPSQINKYINTDGPNQIPTVNKSPDDIVDITASDGQTRSMTLSKDGSLIWFTGTQTDTIYEWFLPGVLLNYEVTSVNITTGDFTIKVEVSSIEDLSFIQIAFGNLAATDDSTVLGAGTTLSTFVTPLLTKDEDNFLVDDQGRNIVAVQS